MRDVAAVLLEQPFEITLLHGRDASRLHLRKRALPAVARVDPPQRIDADPAPSAHALPTAVARPSRIGALGFAGVGLLAATVPLTAIGLGLTLSPLRPYDDDPLKRLDLRPAGVSVLSFAPVLLVTGVTLLLLDRRDHRRLSLAPQASPSSAGVLLHGRF